MLTQLAAVPEVRAAALFNPTGAVAAWKGAETLENLRPSSKSRKEFTRQKEETGTHEQKFFSTFYPTQRPSKTGIAREPTNPPIPTYGAGWRLVVLLEGEAARKGLEQLRQHLERDWQEFVGLLSQE
ncbi:hypothetical protein [Dictyobacter formicarum]|uniref:Uncharacterized protein n=1 Tax=Dictyobacter formicarum TaxID=2778368 RepID=A0ABQ3VUM0_9CHLR|nr:hypothetical protein [Dictyobacter formicarum]GHO89451.1 hypothetical protein KSZ_74570 [Dictyobacter formicarum]